MGDEGIPYEGAAVAGAVLGTVFFPLISLIAALLLQGSQPDPVKRQQLQKWAWLSAGWLALQGLFFVLVFASIAHSSGPHPFP